jgi:hypothetical protein
MTNPSEIVPLNMRVKAVILWLGGSAVIGSLALVFWYQRTLRRFQDADKEPNGLWSTAQQEDEEY